MTVIRKIARYVLCTYSGGETGCRFDYYDEAHVSFAERGLI